MKTFLVDFTGASGIVYALNFECEFIEQAEAMAKDVARGWNVQVRGELVMSIPIEDVDKHSG